MNTRSAPERCPRVGEAQLQMKNRRRKAEPEDARRDGKNGKGKPAVIGPRMRSALRSGWRRSGRGAKL